MDRTLPQTFENCLAPGTRLAEFEIREVIGEGGFGIVYLAFDHSLQRTVAIKEYMPAVLAGRGSDKSVTVRSRQNQETFEKGLRSFINEARLLAQFDHPALIKVYRFWEQNNTAYMVMRYYEGRTLKAIVGESPELVTETWLKAMLGPLLEALETLYRARILHRDISPDNIMVQPDGQAVLLDFGAARQIISDITQSLTVILKPGYAPVEQYADDEMMVQGPWTDIYSLSAVLYLMITKKPPPASVGRMIKDPIEVLANGEHAGFDRPFLDAIDKGLAIRPEDRPQTVDAFRHLLGLPSGMPSYPLAATVAPSLPLTAMGESLRTPDVVIPTPVRDISTSTKATQSPRRFAAAGAVLIGVIALGIVIASIAHKETPKTATPGAIAVVEASASSSTSSETPADEETNAWKTIDSNAGATRADLEAFLNHYPNGKYAAPARFRLESMQGQAWPVHTQDAGGKAGQKKETTATTTTTTMTTGPALGSIKLMIKPWGNVSVDGVAKGPSPPLKLLSLPEGKHQVLIENPAFPSRTLDIEVVGKKQLRIEHSFSVPKP